MSRSPEPGDVLGGRYRVEARIGDGSTGVVYRAVQLALDRPVALKVLHPRLAADDRARARFEREARVASALDHPSAVPIHDFGEVDGHLFLAMEMVEGETLRDRLSGGALPRDEAVDVAWQVADVLAAAHRVGLVHRDLKPDNVFVEPASGRRRARVVDFGLAFVTGDSRSGRLTVEGVVAGTPGYLSPEQARGRDVGPPTDVYALGCTLFEMLEGQRPFRGADMDVLARQMYAPPPPLRGTEGVDAVPTALAALVEAMLRKRARERPDAATVRDRLLALDPAARERARDQGMLMGRAARMVAEPSGGSPRPNDAPEPEVAEVAVVGTIPPELLVGLSVSGLAPYVVNEEQPLADAAAVYAPGIDAARARELAATGVPLVTDTDAADVARITELLRAGAAEVIARPVTAEELSRRLLRVLRRRRRQGGG